MRMLGRRAARAKSWQMMAFSVRLARHNQMTMKNEHSDSIHRPDRYVTYKPTKERMPERSFAKPTMFRHPISNAQQIVVVGTFNNWNAEANPMERLIDGAWQTIIELPRGHHEYYFLVDGAVVLDRERGTVPDGKGGKRNVLEV